MSTLEVTDRAQSREWLRDNAARRALLESIARAKRPETRERRIAHAVDRATRA